MMTESHFEKRLKEIDAGYCQRRENADAYRDQELARLFGECEWVLLAQPTCWPSVS
jgi:hypothetical protein